MTRTFLSLLVSLPIAGYVAWRLGGPSELQGAGVIAGFLVGAAVAVWGIAYQRHVLLHRPANAQTAALIDFGVKLGVVLVGGIALRSMPELAARCDWRAFLLTFASISLVVLLFGTVDAVRVLGNPTPAEGPAK